ncbi:MAG: HD domain-containing protein [Fibrobacteria bacterium]|nr:HD domain-containing protein [Fibrobacteria bacterium]
MLDFPSRLVPVVSLVRTRLEEGLSPSLFYHGLHHTFDDVLPAVDRLAVSEKVAPPDRDLLLAAALFHDTGFLERYNGNEPIGARIAAETLPAHGYSSHEIERILDLILATELQDVEGVMLQVPGADSLKRILCDADLDNLGRDDFFQVSDNLRAELEEHGRKLGDLEWYSRQVLFLSQHRWFTESQRHQREAGKARNLRALKEILRKVSSESSIDDSSVAD